MIQNRRLREVRSDIEKYRKRLEEAQSISDSLIYQGKIESLEREEQDIIQRYEVKT